LTTSVTPDPEGQKLVPTYLLSSFTQTGDHTYVVNLPDDLPDGAGTGINSARMYFSMDADMSLTVNGDSVGSVNAPVPDDSYFDFIEFSLNAPANPGNLNIDTTNVDQFGIPIQIKVDSAEVGTATDRSNVFTQFDDFLTGADDPYAWCIWPSDGTYGPYRILNPSGVLDQIQPAINIVQVKTVLQEAISAGDTVINVYSAAAFPPASSNFTIQIDSELMTVVAAAQLANGTTNWTVLRGQQGTSAAAHNSSTPVTMQNPVVTASQTSITVAGTTNFPTSYPFRILVDAEIMTVTGVKSNNLDGTTTWNVSRGQYGTTATTHNEGAQVYYNAAVDNPLNDVFNEAIDALFTKYLNPAPGEKLQVHSTAGGADRIYEGEVVQVNGAYVMQFVSTTDPDSIEYNVYYPFFEVNQYFWAGHTPQLAVAEAPDLTAGADISSLSPSMMVFGCEGVFADNKYRPDGEYTADELKILADLENQMVSALNRGVGLLQGYTVSGADSWEDTSKYYENNPDGQVWNRYAQFLHKDTVSIDGKNYGFAFDDQDGQASDISSDSFSSITITLGEWADNDNPDPGPGPTPDPDPDPNPDPDPTPTPNSNLISQRMLLSSYIDPEHSPEGDSQSVQSFSLLASEDSSQVDANALVMAALAAEEDDSDDDELNDDEVEELLLDMLPSVRSLLSSSLYS
jgi:hypothetical protein